MSGRPPSRPGATRSCNRPVPAARPGLRNTPLCAPRAMPPAVSPPGAGRLAGTQRSKSPGHPPFCPRPCHRALSSRPSHAPRVFPPAPELSQKLGNRRGRWEDTGDRGNSPGHGGPLETGAMKRRRACPPDKGPPPAFCKAGGENGTARLAPPGLRRDRDLEGHHAARAGGQGSAAIPPQRSGIPGRVRGRGGHGAHHAVAQVHRLGMATARTV